METCLECGRRIGRMRKGRGGFRRHMKSKGVICPGSWQYPSKQITALKERARQHAQIGAQRTASNDGAIFQEKNGG